MTPKSEPPKWATSLKHTVAVITAKIDVFLSIGPISLSH